MNALTKIVAAAKKLQRSNPKLDWKQAVKKASAAYRAAKPKKKVGQSHTDTGSHNVRIRVVSGRKKKAAPARKAGSVLLLEKGESARKKPARIYTVNRTKKGTYKKFSRVAGSNLPQFSDPDLARDILYSADSDSTLYFRRRQPIEKNLYRKYKKGTFDLQRSAKLWLFYINDADKWYQREVMHEKEKGYLLTLPERKLLALEKATDFYADLQAGNTFE